ncbi:MAG: hypothetical protein A2Y10_04980 [Planctomycetes bacterium GWF2_41_51]|nr:MAG: hypothetical protein A2Y10_04980 [Planctomycetes bacterium GWF2_41_51]HBG25582.1 hypothetical protein [Phycisphaerales bacterium]
MSLFWGLTVVSPANGYECLDDNFMRCKTSSNSPLTSTANFQLTSGNPEIAVYDEYNVFTNSKKMTARLSLFGNPGSGTQKTELTRIFDDIIEHAETAYTCSFDIFIDGNWTESSTNRAEVYFAKDSDLMFAYEIRGDSHLFNARRISDGQWYNKFSQLQARPIGWNHIDIVVYPDISSGVLEFYINGILMCVYEDSDAFGFPGNFNAQFVDRIAFIVWVNNQGPSLTNSIYIDNIYVQSGANPILGGDFDKISGVNFKDFNTIATQWLLGQQCGLEGDLNNDCTVDITDFEMFVSNWLIE